MLRKYGVFILSGRTERSFDKFGRRIAGFSTPLSGAALPGLAVTDRLTISTLTAAFYLL